MTAHPRAGEPAHLVDNLEEALESAPPPAPNLARRDVPHDLLAPASIDSLVRMTIEEWVMIAVLLTAIALAPWWAYPALAFLLAGRFHALGVVLHDLTHMPLRGKTVGARFVEIFCGYPIASTLNAMRYHHLRHHRDSGMETDPYYKDGEQTVFWWSINIARGLILVPFWTTRAYLGSVAYFVPGLRNVYAHVFLQDKTSADLRNSREVIDCTRADIGQALFQTALLAVTVAWPTTMAWFYIVPIEVTGVLSARRVLIEHNYERVADRKLDTIIATTNDNHLGLLGAMALAPRNIGFHIVHHIHPQVSLRALPKLRAWYESKHPEIYPPPAR